MAELLSPFRRIDPPTIGSQLLRELGVKADQLVFLPGSNDAEDSAYMSTAGDLYKLCIERGLDARWAQPQAQRRFLALRSADVFLPTLAFIGGEILTAGGAAILSECIRHFLTRAPSLRDVKLFVRVVRVQHEDGSNAEWFEANGPADAVLEALEKWRE